MANVSKLIFGAAIAAASIATPALAAHNGKPAHHHHVGYVTSSQGSGVYNFAPPRYFLPPNDGGPANCCNGSEPGGF